MDRRTEDVRTASRSATSTTCRTEVTAPAGRHEGALFGNWQVSGLLVARSGMPGTVTVGSPIPGGDARPNLLHDPNLPSSERSVDHWFDTTAFAANYAADGRRCWPATPAATSSAAPPTTTSTWGSSSSSP